MKKPLFIIVLIFFALSSCTKIQNGSSQGTTIGEIQGCGHISPMNGRHVINVQGVVTHKFSNGFSMQSVIKDDLDCSSEGIFVTTTEYPKVVPGQLVSVDGNVVEYIPGGEKDHNLSRTEIHQPVIKVINQNYKIPEPIVIDKYTSRIPDKAIKLTKTFDIERNGLDYFESLEFMLVEIEDGIVVGPKNVYNEFFVLPKSFIEMNRLSQQNALLKSETDENPEKIMVDAASSFTQKVNVGDELLQPIIGIMDYSFANYKIWTISNPVLTKNEIKNNEIKIDDELLTIASYNLNNFSRFDKSSRINKVGCQIVKILKTPDILILNEVLDDSGTQDDGITSADQTLKILVKSIADCGGPVYRFSDSPPVDGMDGGVNGGNIRTVVIYKDNDELFLEKPDDSSTGLKLKNNQFRIQNNPLRLFEDDTAFLGTRKPTIWLFNWKNEQFLVLGLHLISQSTNSPDWGDIHPIITPDQEKREKQAILINEYLSQKSFLQPEPNIIILGDFNDYSWSNTLKVLHDNQNFVLLSNEQPEEDYSYIHQGNAFQFDYAFVNKMLSSRVSMFTIPHINSIINSEDQVSDHDPLLFAILPLK